MPFEFERLELNHPDLLLDGGAPLQTRAAQATQVEAPRLQRLWHYYRNPIGPGDARRPYRQAQEWGLPPRITGVGAADDVTRKEVVIENDIGWRVDAMVDFLFGKPIVVNSAASDPDRRARIERVVRRVLSLNGGIAFLQRLALLGAVYGYVDVLVKYVPPGSDDPDAADPRAAADEQLLGQRAGRDDVDLDAHVGEGVRFEIVEPTRALPLLSATDPTRAVGYAQHYAIPGNAKTPGVRRRRAGISWADALKQALLRTPGAARDRAVLPDVGASSGEVAVLEIITPSRWQRYEDERLVAEGENSLGRLPLVHVQNAPLPFEYAGASDVEPLMPLQDELNTRLSDRAYRITMQSQKMYLGRGIENFADLPIGPGRMYASDDPTATIVEFGGDSACPSEQAHVDEVREALDKTSGVSPIAAGAIKGRVGRLTSAAALRVTLMAILARTERKRTAYGPAIAQLCELSLAWLDRAGVFRTTPDERRVEIHWPSPIPANEAEQLEAAKAKRELGVDAQEVTRELGY